VYVSDVAVYDTFVVGKPQQTAKWKIIPSIRVCASTKARLTRVEHAAWYWKKLGYKFDSIFVDHRTSCSEPKYGEIIITLPEGNSFNNGHLASTRLYTEKISGNIAKAKIFILPNNTKKERVLEHEIGHALGWRHHGQKFHIMHPNWMEGGTDNTGLRKSRD
jgi:hypothetical protein